MTGSGHASPFAFTTTLSSLDIRTPLEKYNQTTEPQRHRGIPEREREREREYKR
jgi:hypothetical protein